MSLYPYKLIYFSSQFLKSLIPRSPFETKRHHLLKAFESADIDNIEKRVAYYNKVKQGFAVKRHGLNPSTPIDLSYLSYNTLRSKKMSSAQYYDLKSVLRYFPKDYYFYLLSGDNVSIPDSPALTKSRPIEGDNGNCVLLKLNSIRHFRFYQDSKKFKDKKSAAVFRGACYQPHRQYFLQQCMQFPRVNAGDTAKSAINTPFYVPKMSPQEQLEYKFIISVEGNDVATNLKWIMNSQSLCFMRKPRFETWFMEGTLIPNYHYVLLKDDFSDMEDKIDFYSNNPDQAEAIIRNANNYVAQFKNARQELLISLLVLKQYFALSGQL